MTPNVLDFTTPVPCWIVFEDDGDIGWRIIGVYSTRALAEAEGAKGRGLLRKVLRSTYHYVRELDASSNITVSGAMK